MNKTIESLWPVEFKGRTISYEDLVSHLTEFLTERGVEPSAFSHVGIVVADVAKATGTLANLLGGDWPKLESVWGEAFGCRIARKVDDGVEYEFIQPERESFLKDFLNQGGEGVNHLSFYVSDIETCLKSLCDSGAMAEPRIHEGLHGRIAFTPGILGPVCIELCETVQD